LTPFGGAPVDLIIDDAAHLYAHTRKTFENNFPTLRSGGLYIIEDWSWAHSPATQERGGPYSGFDDEPALSNLVFELVMIVGSFPDLIENIEIYPNMAVVRKGHRQLEKNAFKLDDFILSRGRILNKI
jgi:hypothetical protein